MTVLTASRITAPLETIASSTNSQTPERRFRARAYFAGCPGALCEERVPCYEHPADCREQRPEQPVDLLLLRGQVRPAPCRIRARRERNLRTRQSGPRWRRLSACASRTVHRRMD